MKSLVTYIYSYSRQLDGPTLPIGWKGFNKLGDESDIIRVEVNNVLTEKKISNVFGVIKGIVDPGQTQLARLESLS